MNKFTKWTGILAAFCLTAMTLSLAGCGDGGKNSVKKYTVDFETNGGSAAASQQVEEGGKAVKPDDPTKTDYVFSGWCKDAALENVYDFETETVTSDTTIYASWASSRYVIANFIELYGALPRKYIHRKYSETIPVLPIPVRLSARASISAGGTPRTVPPLTAR